MGKGHKDRRREKRAREIEERDKDERLLKEEVEEEAERLQSMRQQQESEKVANEKPNETLSDTRDSGHGSSVTTSTDSLPSSKTEPVDSLTRRSLIKGLINIGNTCFFNVIIQSLAHTPLLLDAMYEDIRNSLQGSPSQCSSTITAQLLQIFDEFTLDDKKKANINPKTLFNSLIRKIPTYEGYGQHDSHELFMNLMLILRAEESELKKLKTQRRDNYEDADDLSKMFCLIGCNEAYTTYDSIFGGHLLDVISCKRCEKALMKIEPFIGLLLPLNDRMSPSENYRNRRKREDYKASKSKTEPKILSRKQQRALKKHEKKNNRRSATGKIRGRQSATKKNFQEQASTAESSDMPNGDEPTVELDKEQTNEENAQKESVVDAKEETSNQEEGETTTVTNDDDDVDDDDRKEDEEQQQNSECSENDDEVNGNDDEQKPTGPLKAVEAICTLSDMVSKLTLIHEKESRPLPFVDENVAQKFLNCYKSKQDSSATDNTESISTLEQCFQRYFKPETLSGENLFDCYYCRSLDPTQKRVLTEATRQTIFFQLPPVLPVFLKRFQMYNTRSDKIKDFIEFPLRLDLTNRCSTQVKSVSAIYSLYAVIEHTGTLRSGHYVAYVKQSNTENDLSRKDYSKPIDYLLETLFQTRTDEHNHTQNSTNEKVDPSSPSPSWYYISDNSIHKVPESKVLQAEAYVLFYRKVCNES